MDIKVNIYDRNSIMRAIEQLKAAKKEAEKHAIPTERLKQFAEEIAVPILEEMYTEAAMSSDTPDEWFAPRIHVEEEADGKVRIYAEGRDVGFLEFGTGYFNPEYSKEGFPKHGSYGKGHGMRAQWGFKGMDGEIHLTHGIEPTEAMLVAANELRARAREWFRND